MNDITAHEKFNAVSPYIRYAHYYRTGEDFRIPHRIIYDHLFLYTHEGYGWVGIEDRWYRQGPGTLFYIRPGIPHAFHADDGPDHLLMYNLHFDFVQDADSEKRAAWWPNAEPLSPYRFDPTSDPAYRLPEAIEHFVPEVYEHDFFEILSHVSRSSLASKLQVKAAMIHLLAHLYHLYHLHSHDNAHSLPTETMCRLERIPKYMVEHLATPLTLAHLAEQCLLSRSHFSACFKVLYGCTPMRYLTQLRVAQARLLLEQSDKPIKQITEVLGFPTVHYFTRVFRNHVGLPPAAYRQRYRPVG